jgi:hypothetical protein
MVAKCVHSHAPNFHVLAPGVIATNEGLHLIAHRFFKRTLAGYRGLARSFATTTGLGGFTRTPAVKASEFCGSLTSGQRAAQSSL